MAPHHPRAVRWAESRRGLVCLFAAGLALRLLLAPHGGVPFDLDLFAAWARRLAEHGPSGFYRQPGLADYPPGYLDVLWLIGRLSRGSAPAHFVLKLPAIAADLGAAWTAAVLAARVTPPALAARFPCRAVAAAAILFNPALVLLSAVWGQVDSLLGLLVLVAVVLLGTGPATLRRELAGGAVVGLAVATKSQAVFAVPALALVLAWRHRGAGVAATLARGPARTGTAGVAAGGRPRTTAIATALRVIAPAVVAAAVVLALFAPFGEGPRGAADFYTGVTRTYPYTSLWAFNVWGLAGFYRADAAGPGAVRVLGISAQVVGLSAFLAAAVLLCARAWTSLRRAAGEAAVMLMGTAAVTATAFAVLTRMHERYLYLALACLAPLVASRPIRGWLAALSLLFLADVSFVYLFLTGGSPGGGLAGPGAAVYGGTGDSLQKKLLSAVTAAVCLLVAWRGPAAVDRMTGGPRSGDGEPAPAVRTVLGASPAGEDMSRAGAG